MPEAKKEVFSKKYYDKWAESYDTGWRLKFWFWRILRRTWHNIRLRDSAAIYDMGCGTGRLLRYIREKYPNAVLYGTDISEGMLGKARDSFRDIEGASVKFKTADMNEQLPWADEMFDYVITTYCFHHSKDPVKNLGEIIRILKPGGRLYLADLCYPLLINGLVNRIYPRILKWKGHIEFLGRGDLRCALNDAGFSGISLKRLSVYAVFATAVKS